MPASVMPHYGMRPEAPPSPPPTPPPEPELGTPLLGTPPCPPAVGLFPVSAVSGPLRWVPPPRNHHGPMSNVTLRRDSGRSSGCQSAETSSAGRTCDGSSTTDSLGLTEEVSLSPTLSRSVYSGSSQGGDTGSFRPISGSASFTPASDSSPQYNAQPLPSGIPPSTLLTAPSIPLPPSAHAVMHPACGAGLPMSGVLTGTGPTLGSDESWADSIPDQPLEHSVPMVPSLAMPPGVPAAAYAAITHHLAAPDAGQLVCYQEPQSPCVVDVGREFAAPQRCDMVFTPWFPEGVSYRTIRLQPEMDAFASFMSLSHEERTRRNAVRTLVQETVSDMGWAEKCTVKVYGSFAYGLAIPFSALDLVCENCGTNVCLKEVGTALTARGLTVTASIACGGGDGQGGFIKVQACGVEANISFVPGESLARRTVSLARGWMAEFPTAISTAIVVRSILSQSRCDSPRTGGLSAYAVLAMVVYICRSMPPPLECDKVLYQFLLTFSTKFDFDSCGIDAKAGVPVTRPVEMMSEQLYVLDPLDPANNLAMGCTRMAQIKAQFKYCLTAIGKWDPSSYTHGYKGRTPLSAIISHRWVDQQRPQGGGMKGHGGVPHDVPPRGTPSSAIAQAP